MLEISFVPPMLPKHLETIRCRNVTTAWVLVTPELAQLWLEFNLKNRPISHNIVETMTSDRIKDNWVLTHEGIAFTDGALLADGQKRLLSIVKSGISFPMLVSWGLSEEARLAIDRNQVRSTAHALLMSGYEFSSNRVVAIARRMMCGVSYKTLPPPSDSDTRDFLAKHVAAISFAAEHLKNFQAAIPALFARAYYHAEPQALEAAALYLREGDGSACENVTPLLRLRDHLLKNPNRYGNSGQTAIYRRAQNALRSHLDGKPLAKLYECTEDLFPLPDSGSVPTLSG